MIRPEVELLIARIELRRALEPDPPAPSMETARAVVALVRKRAG